MRTEDRMVMFVKPHAGVSSITDIFTSNKTFQQSLSPGHLPVLCKQLVHST
jgi:hypothetical protein